MKNVPPHTPPQKALSRVREERLLVNTRMFKQDLYVVKTVICCTQREIPKGVILRQRRSVFCEAICALHAR